ncbi:MAG: 23S rRNA (pseudouridine(1915)-N(3))-methyltransferase RlmH [Candidatus Aenigmarchaeota archaeon]|nr:23S rRNA (pseudouridine(1915)-N(3))-methyltransferase RlmH [Candidatus Aenigmarchaeota archaeon]
MSVINIIYVGRTKEKYIQSGIEEYEKRLIRRRIHTVEIKDSTKPKEAAKMIALVEKIKDSFVVALDEYGEEFTSIEFADFIKARVHKNICFVIGGPDGLDKIMLDKSDKIVSLSKMTFTHEMAKLILFEQIYRAFAIIDGKKYHRS